MDADVVAGSTFFNDALNDIRATRECFHRLMGFIRTPAEMTAGAAK